jgi:uncharacterized protein (DUF934 family)
MKLIANYPISTSENPVKILEIANDTDVASLHTELDMAEVVTLHFPKFTDGRAFSQAVQLRRRLGYEGDIRATGDVLIDQLVQLKRSGFSSAVLRADQDAAHGQTLLQHYSGFYQGDAAQAQPLFAKQAA